MVAANATGTSAQRHPAQISVDLGGYEPAGQRLAAGLSLHA